MSTSMNVQDMRGHVEALYPSKVWRDKVKRMPDNQIIAIYKSKIERGPEPRKPRKEEDEFPF
jgi:hypothetical protein